MLKIHNQSHQSKIIDVEEEEAAEIVFSVDKNDSSSEK